MPAPATSAPTSSRSRPREDPNRWQPIGAEHGEQISNGILENWDTAGFDGLYTLRLSVMENSGNVLTYDAPLAVDNAPPKVRIVHPGKDQLYKMEDDEFVSITADAEDNWEMDRVEFYLDGAKVGESTVAPYGHRWTIKMADKAPKLGSPIMATRTITNTDGTVSQEEYVQSEAPGRDDHPQRRHKSSTGGTIQQWWFRSFHGWQRPVRVSYRLRESLR